MCILFREKRKMKKVTFNKLTRNYSVRFKENSGSVFVGGKTINVLPAIHL